MALSAGKNLDVLAEQIKKFKPKMVSISEGAMSQAREMIADMDGPAPELLYGEDGMIEVARHEDVDSTVTGIVGCAGLLSTVAAIEVGKNICLANKETLIAGGPADRAAAGSTA